MPTQQQLLIAGQPVPELPVADVERAQRYYRDTVFVPQPGPDTATAREVAARYANPRPGTESAETAAG